MMRSRIPVGIVALHLNPNVSVIDIKAENACLPQGVPAGAGAVSLKRTRDEK